MAFFLHPFLVHFPIALLCTASVWTFVRKGDHELAWRLWCVGTAAAVLASTAGIYAYLPLRRSALASPLMQHQLWGLGASVAALAWAMWRGYQRHIARPDPGQQSWGRGVGLIIAVGTLLAASTGGALVMEHGPELAHPSQEANPKHR